MCCQNQTKNLLWVKKRCYRDREPQTMSSKSHINTSNMRMNVNMNMKINTHSMNMILSHVLPDAFSDYGNITSTSQALAA